MTQGILPAVGGTKHRVKRNRRRTVKAAATYGAAYRKYNRMYGGADPPAPADPPPADPPSPGLWDKVRNFVTKDNNKDENEEKKTAEEPGLFEKASAKVKETVNETVATTQNIASTAENTLNDTKNMVSNAADTLKATASAVGTTLETSGAMVKNQLGTAIDTIDSAGKDAAKPENAEENNDAVVEEEKSVAAAAAAPDAETGETEMTDDKRRIKELEERIRKMTSGTIAKAIEAAEQATGSVEDALKALQLAFIASKTVIAAGKAALVANSGNDEESVLSQGSESSEPVPDATAAATGTSALNDDDSSPVAAAEPEATAENGEGEGEGQESDVNEESSVSSDDDSSDASSVSTEGEGSGPVVSDDIPPENAEPVVAQPQPAAEPVAQPQPQPQPPERTEASKATDALNADGKIEGGKSHKHKSKHHRPKNAAAAAVNNRTRRQ